MKAEDKHANRAPTLDAFPAVLCPRFNATPQIQQFVVSMTVADFNSSGDEGNSSGARGSAEGDGGRKAVAAVPETGQARLKRLAAAVVQELRKGTDVGSITAARAQAIRR